MADYLRLMMAEQAAARTAYSFDPREVLNRSRYMGSNNVEAFNGTRPTNIPEVDPADYTDIPEGSRSDPSVVQASPTTRAAKRYVIIDASQRDWVKQPNPYTNLVYSFGSQALSPSNPPVYTNNPFIPTFAVEQQALTAPIPGIPNAQGWTLPGALSGTGADVRYPGYNSSLSRGNFLAFDTGYVIQPSGSGFGSVFTPCNVQSIRLVRAVLPQRQFLNIPVDVSGSVDYPTSQFIESNIVGRPYSTFTTHPYLLLYLNEYFGQYVGGNEPMRRSFSVMTQKQRQQTRFDVETGAQQYDYEPWGEEALRLQSPITNLQRLAITVTDPVGTNFVQNDNLTLSLIQATSNKMYLQCFTPSFQYFSSNELRVGDRILFYSNTISDMLKSQILSALNPDKRSFITAISNATFPVLQLLDYVADANGIYVPRDASTARTQPYVSSYNGFLIPNFVTIGADGTATPTFPGSIDAGTNTVLEPDVLVGSNLAFLNVTLQPVYTLELETLQPDTGSIGGTIVL
jgi:hypothetical protein